MTATTITVGITYLANASAVNAAIGASAITNGDERGDAQAIADEINRHGGIRGRRLVLKFLAVQAHSTYNPQTQAQSDCAYWTQDHPVFAVLSSVSSGLEAPCFDRAGTPLFRIDAMGDEDRLGYQHVFQPEGMGLNRLGAAMVGAFGAGGWYTGWNTVTGSPGTQPVKTAIVVPDGPGGRHLVSTVLLPGLRAAGHGPDPIDVVYLTAGNAANLEASISNAILRFRKDGVTHVVLLDNTGSITLLFADEAKSQQYYPRYGGSSGNGFQLLVDSGVLTPAVIAGSVAAGWVPEIDVSYHSPEWNRRQADNRAGTWCNRALAAGGEHPSDGNTTLVAYQYCDSLRALSASLANVPNPSQPGYAQAYEALKDTFSNANTMQPLMGPGRHDAASHYQPLVYQPGCSCMQYVGTEAAV